MKREQWDINRFDTINLPAVIMRVEDTESFSDMTQPVRVLDLPVYMPKQGLRIPDYIKPVFQDIIKHIISHEDNCYGDMDDHYVYVTLDQKVVPKGKTGRREGAHSDAYIEREGEQIDITENSGDVVKNEEGDISNTYIVYDCLPTEFFTEKFPLNDTTCEGSLKTFDEISNSATPVKFPPYYVLKLTPYVVHRASVCQETTERTFMNVSVSKKQYRREGNTINPLFDYDWEYTPRSDARNHPW